MNVLPRLLYIIQMLPSYISSKIFKQIHSAIRAFLWNNKRPRMELQKLQLPIQKGGLGIPNFQFYHWASQLKFVSEWVKNGLFCFPDLEGIGLDTAQLEYLPFLCLEKVYANIKNNYILKNICKSLSAIRKHFSIDKYSFSAPIANNPDFQLTCTDSGFKEWREVGITKISDLYVDDFIKSFQQLKNEFNLPQAHFFRYLQIRSYLNSITYYKNGVKNSILDNIFIKAVVLKDKIITNIYDHINMNTGVVINIKKSWEYDFGVKLDDQQWIKVLNDAKQITKSNKSHEVQYKIINKMHVTPVTRSKYETCTTLCFKCKKEAGTYFHLMWSCPIILSFWSSVLQETEKYLGVKVPEDPKACILAYIPHAPTRQFSINIQN
uniref:Reverse transcriptase zinc-binding domain-containing protein n=1 Tax=Periophthalmus magnuspinnatus TaxID=409849 RepID=A0A3B3Z6M4_9GOBI